MKRDDFIEMINDTTFDADLKKLFLTSYDMGHSQGKLDQMYLVLQRMELADIEKEMNDSIRH